VHLKKRIGYLQKAGKAPIQCILYINLPTKGRFIFNNKLCKKLYNKFNKNSICSVFVKVVDYRFVARAMNSKDYMTILPAKPRAGEGTKACNG